MGADGKLQDSLEPAIDRRRALLVTIAALLFQLGLAAYGFSRLPISARVAVHWDAAGHPNGYGDAIPAFIAVPILTALISLGLAFLPAVEPRRRNLQLSGAAYVVVWISVLLLMAAVQAAIVLGALGLAPSTTVVHLVPAAVGVMLAVVGNYLGKVRSNYLFGIRTPWTLSSERSWNRTHRLGGRLFVALGFLAAATSAFPWLGFAVLGAGLPAILVIVLIYSYVQWRDDPTQHPNAKAP